MTVDDNKILSISDLNRQVRRILEEGFRWIWVRGEVSNFLEARSGHWYFNLKDHKARLRCVMFRNHNQRIRIRLKDGLSTIVQGRVSLYEPRGDFQLQAEYIEPVGEGLLRLAYEQLRQRLEREGLFNSEHKRPLPVFPRCIGVVTSKEGAVLHDILTTLERRCPLVAVKVFPALVQGERASGSLMAALESVRSHNAQHPDDPVEVVIMGRGGGSMEDMQGFNDERLARRIFAFPLPLVSAVGHETDFTIADFVADLRAPTPTAAAELVSADQAGWRAEFTRERDGLCDTMRRRMALMWRDLDELTRLLKDPQESLQHYCHRLQDLDVRGRRALLHKLALVRSELDHVVVRLQSRDPVALVRALHTELQLVQERLRKAVLRVLQHKRQLLDIQRKALKALSPFGILERGYALLRTTDDAHLVCMDDVDPGQRISAHLASGSLICLVEEVDRISRLLPAVDRES